MWAVNDISYAEARKLTVGADAGPIRFKGSETHPRGSYYVVGDRVIKSGKESLEFTGHDARNIFSALRGTTSQDIATAKRFLTLAKNGGNEPEGIEKLESRLAALEARRETMEFSHANPQTRLEHF